jgi:hypothetical protein|tara:strand:+ start:91 stop:1530 length:1440 start_codon:yes stop_codon:yes gene_type:complete
MAQTIKVKRSTSTVAPTALANGELAYSHVGSNGKLYIGRPGGSTGDVDVIGGKYYIDRSETAYGWGDHSTEGYLVAGSSGYNNTQWDTAYTYSQVGHLPLSGGTVTGNIAVSGTVDGRDVAADGTKLDGIAASANNYSLPLATNTVRGGIELFSNTDQSVAANSVTTTASRTYGIQLNSANQAVVNVPWSDTNTNTTYSVGDGGLTQKNFTTTLKNKLDGIAASANNYSLPLGSASTRGGVKIGYTENGKNYPVELSSEKMYVNVPWADTNTTYSVGDGGLTQKNFTTTLKNKLDGIETGATGDQTNAEIRTAVGAASDSNVFTDADHTKLNGIATSANNYSLSNLNYHLSSGVGNILCGRIRGPANMVIDPAAHGDDTGTVTIAGNLTVSGTTTTINSTVVEIADERVVVNREQTGTPTAALVAGLEVERGTSNNAFLLWRETNSGWYVSDGGASDFELLHANNWSTSYTGVVDGGSF